MRKYSPFGKKNLLKSYESGFRVHIAKNIGLGHFKRLDILKKKLKQNVTWIVSGDKKIIYSNLKKIKIYLLLNH